MAGLLPQSVARRAAVWIMALTLAATVAVGASRRNVRTMSLIGVSDFAVRAWVEMDGPQTSPPAGIFLSIRFLGLRFVIEWSGFDQHHS